MFWKKKAEPSPMGIPLSELESLLIASGVNVKRKGNALLADNGRLITHLEVIQPEVKETEDGEISAVVRLTTELPKTLDTFFDGKQAEAAAMFNAFASLGAIYSKSGKVIIGSRLTVYEGEGAWPNLQLPLLLFTTLCSADSILGGARRTFSGEPPNLGASKWDDGDFDEANYYLSRLGYCNFDTKGLTVEYGLAEGEVSALVGSGKTALFQLLSDQPHPELGGGLFCLLQMPHQIGDEGRLANICMQLNTMEMAAMDLPPHFGAWCPSEAGANLAYVSFLPNPLLEVKGIAHNFGIWAFHRAQWANAMLASMGVCFR